MSRPKLNPVLAARLNELGLQPWCAHQPPYLFPDDGRKLKRCAISTDPWSVMLVRRDRVVWADGGQVSHAIGETFDAAVEAAIPTGLQASIMRLSVALDKLTEAMRAG